MQAGRQQDARAKKGCQRHQTFVVEPLADHVEHEVILVHVSLLGQSRLYARYASTVEMPSQQLHEEAHLPARGLAAFSAWMETLRR